MAINLEDIHKEVNIAEQKDIEALNKKLENAQTINITETGTNIVLDDNADLQLEGRPQEIELNIPRCNFCGHAGTPNRPLFTIDETSYICKPCLIYGFRTMLLNDVPMPTIEEMGDKNNAEFDAYKW